MAAASMNQQMMSMMMTLGPQMNLLNRTVGRLIDAIQAFDEIQQNAMSVGLRGTHSMRANTEILRGHPGGMKEALDSSIGLMQAGFIKHSRGMVSLVAQAKVTGQDSKQIISGFAKLSSAMPLSTKRMDELGENIIQSSLKYGIQTGDLMQSLAKHSDTIARFAALGGQDQDMIKAMSEVTSKAGAMHSDTVGMLAEKLTFKEGAEDLSRVILQTGDAQLAARMQSGKASDSLLMDMNNAFIAQYDQLVSTGADNRMIRSEVAKQLGFDVKQIMAMKALQNSMDTSRDLTTMGLKDIEITYNESIGTLIKEIAAPIQTMLIPIIETISYVIAGVKNGLGGLGAPIAFMGRVLVRAVFFLTTLVTIQKMVALWSKIGAVTGVTGYGAIIMAVGALAFTVGESIVNANNRADDEARERRRNREDKNIESKGGWARYVTGGVIAASLTHTMAMLKTSEETLDAQEKIIAVLNLQRLEAEARAKSRTAPVK